MTAIHSFFPMQDLIAIAIAIATALWLGRALTRQFFAPPCQPPAAGPAGADGFVPLGEVRLQGAAQKKAGASSRTPRLP